MEHTLSDAEKGRLPTPSEEETLDILTAGCIPAYMGAPIAVDDDRIVVSADWADGALTVAAQPDVPRNLTAVLTDANASITAGLLTLTGLDAQGRVVSEVMDITAGLSWVGTKIFAKVTSAVISGTAGTPAAGTDVVKVGVGNVIGTCVDLVKATEVVHCYLGTLVTPTAIAVGESKSGINASGSTYNGTKVLWALLRPAKNA